MHAGSGYCKALTNLVTFAKLMDIFGKLKQKSGALYIIIVKIV